MQAHTPRLIAGSLAVTLVVTIVTTLGCARPRLARPVTFELWTGAAHEGVAVRFRDALETELMSSQRFAKAPDGQLPAIILYIPGGRFRVETKIGNKQRARYLVQFRSGKTTGQLLGTNSGLCWDDELRRCALEVLRDASRVAQRGAVP